MISRQDAAERIAGYLRHETTLAELVDWAESAVMDAEFVPDDVEIVSGVLARLGVADVRAFGLTWDDCERLLGELGYEARVDIVSR